MVACNRGYLNPVYIHAMPASITLRYAPLRRRSAVQRFLRAALWVSVMGTIAWGFYEGRNRVNALESNPSIGPVDWSAVMGSPTLLRAAWDLSSNSSVLSEYRENLDAELKLPFRFREGKVQVSIVIHDRGTKPAIFPPLSVRGSIPRNVGCFPAWVRASGPCLAKGVQVIRPGKSIFVTLSVPADERPADTDLFLPWSEDIFLIGCGGGSRQSHPYGDWSEVPTSAISKFPWP